MSEITWAGVNSNIPKHLPYADEVDMEVLWSLYKLVEAELNLISKARHAEISKGDIDNPNIKPMNLEFGRLRNWLDEISNHLDIDYWVEHDKHYEAYLRYRAGAWNEGHAAKGFMEWVAETIGMGKPATEPTADAQGEVVVGELQGVIEHYIRQGKKIDAVKAYRRDHDVTIQDAIQAVDKLAYNMKLREDNKPTYAALEAALQQAQRERDAALAALRAAETGLEDIANWHFEEADKQTNAYKRYGGVIEETAKEFARRANVTLTKMGMERKAASAQQAANAEGGA